MKIKDMILRSENKKEIYHIQKDDPVLLNEIVSYIFFSSAKQR